jgi:hypothetical protein
VFICRTYRFSSGVATGDTPQTTYFEVPAAAELGASQLTVVTNGISSEPFAIEVVK